jgi:hypothetical protein
MVSCLDELLEEEEAVVRRRAASTQRCVSLKTEEQTNWNLARAVANPPDRGYLLSEQDKGLVAAVDWKKRKKKMRMICGEDFCFGLASDFDCENDDVPDFDFATDRGSVGDHDRDFGFENDCGFCVMSAADFVSEFECVSDFVSDFDFVLVLGYDLAFSWNCHPSSIVGLDRKMSSSSTRTESSTRVENSNCCWKK